MRIKCLKHKENNASSATTSYWWISTEADTLGLLNVKKLNLCILTQLLLSPSPSEVEKGSWAWMSGPASPRTSGRSACGAWCSSAASSLLAAAEGQVHFLILAVVMIQRKGQCTKTSSKCITHFVTKLEQI